MSTDEPRFAGYPRQSPAEKYSGMWGRLAFLLSRRSLDETLAEVERKDDDVWTAALRMQLRKRGMDVPDELSDIELDAWQTALHLATEHTIEAFVSGETDPTVFARLITREARTGSPNEQFIEQCEARLEELRDE